MLEHSHLCPFTSMSCICGMLSIDVLSVLRWEKCRINLNISYVCTYIHKKGNTGSFAYMLELHAKKPNTKKLPIASTHLTVSSSLQYQSDLTYCLSFVCFLLHRRFRGILLVDHIFLFHFLFSANVPNVWLDVSFQSRKGKEGFSSGVLNCLN